MKSTQNITWHNENSEGGHKYSTSFRLHPFASTNPFFFLSSFTIYYHHHSNNPCQKLDPSWLFPLLYLSSPKFLPILSQVFWTLTGLSLIVNLLPKQLQILEKGAETWPHFSMLKATMATWVNYNSSKQLYHPKNKCDHITFLLKLPWTFFPLLSSPNSP